MLGIEYRCILSDPISDVRRESSVLSVQLQKQLSQEERQEAQGLESNVSQKVLVLVTIKINYLQL